MESDRKRIKNFFSLDVSAMEIGCEKNGPAHAPAGGGAKSGA